MREITYCQAINETLHQLMTEDKNVFLIGQGVTSPWYVGMTTEGLLKQFGSHRVFDTPVSESGVTGLAVGSALNGMKPIVCHPRIDFMYYAMDQIINHAANWHYMFGGQLSVPLVIWSIINRGGEQAAQHSQALQAIFAHIPGLKVVMPSTPYDVKGLLVASVEDDNPVIFIDDRWLYGYKEDVPEELYSVELGKGCIRRKGKDVTIVATSYMVYKAIEASEFLEEEGIDVEIIDLRTVKPMDKDIIIKSVKKTKRLVVADAAWKTCGLGAEISASIAESNLLHELKSPIIRVALPDTPAPACSILEKAYYPEVRDIVFAVNQLIGERINGIQS